MAWYCSCRWLIQIVALQRDGDSSDHVTIKSVKDKLKSWQYSSVDSDDLLADLDKMVAEVATYPKDSVTDGIAAVAVGKKPLMANMYLLTICMSIKGPLQMLSQTGAFLCHVSVAQSKGMLPTSTDLMCLCLWVLWQPAVVCPITEIIRKSSKAPVTSHMCVNSGSVCTFDLLDLLAVSWMFLTTQRSDYIAVMNHLKPIQDLTVSEHLKTPGTCAPFADTV